MSNIFKTCFHIIIFLAIILAMTACSNNTASNPMSETAAVTATHSVPTESVIKEFSQQPIPAAATTAPKPSPTEENVSAAPASPSAASTAAPKSVQGVTISITGDEELGVILDSTTVEVDGEISVMSLLQQETRKQKIQMEFSGKGIFAYVKGIANLYEFDQGAKSGWLFKVNGEFADQGAGTYKVKAGDRVEWLYTLDLGKDIGNKR